MTEPYIMTKPHIMTELHRTTILQGMGRVGQSIWTNARRPGYPGASRGRFHVVAKRGRSRQQQPEVAS
jgi:hypothetical protein